jgi:hypothetical protein
MLNPLLTAAYSISPILSTENGTKVTISNIPNGTVLSGTVISGDIVVT